MDYFSRESTRGYGALEPVTDLRRILESDPAPEDRRRQSKPGGIAQKLKNAVCAYLDYWRYEAELSNLLEDFDESVELYNFDSWFALATGNEETDFPMDDPFIEEYEAISAALENMSRLRRRMEEQCKMALRVALRSREDCRIKIFGRDHRLSDWGIEEFTGVLFENIYDYDFEFMSGDMQEDCDHFIAYVNGRLDDFYKAHE